MTNRFLDIIIVPMDWAIIFCLLDPGILFILFPKFRLRLVTTVTSCVESHHYDDVIKWRHFPRYWPFVRGIHRSPVNSPHKGQWRGALMFSLIWARIDGWVNNHEAADLRRYRAHYDVTVMTKRKQHRKRFHVITSSGCKMSQTHMNLWSR